MALNEQPSNPQPEMVVDAAATAAEEATGEVSARQLIDEAKRHFALKEYVAASDKLAIALDELSKDHAEDADELAPVLQLYGQSVLENFILNSGALGGGGGSAPLPAAAPAPIASSSKASGSSSSSSAVKNDPRFSFTGDAEDDDEDDEEGAPGAGAAEGDDEDDLHTAFSVLDLARVIYQRILDSESQKLTTLDGQEWRKTRIQAELAEVLNLLGDVGLESENFTQASADYRSSLDVLLPLLNPHSRRLADAHLRLGLALEFHPEVEQRKGAKAHVQSASDVLAARVAAIQARIDSGATKTTDATSEGKEKDDLADLTDEAALQKELSDVQQLKKELDTKLEEYETEDGQAQLNGQPDLTGVLGLPADAAAAAAGMSTKDALQQAIKDAFLGAQAEGAAEVNPFTGASKSTSADAPVNNLSSMVKRKKKADADEPTTAAAEEANGESDAKKARTEA